MCSPVLYNNMHINQTILSRNRIVCDVLWSGFGRRGEENEGREEWGAAVLGGGEMRFPGWKETAKYICESGSRGESWWYSAITVKRERRSCCCEREGRGLSRRGRPVADWAPAPMCGQETGKRPWGRRSPGESSRSVPAKWAAAAWRGERPESASGSPAAGSGIGRCCPGNGGGGSSKGKRWGACWRTGAGREEKGRGLLYSQKDKRKYNN